MIDREELIPHFEWLAGSKYYDQTVGEAALAIELTALGHGWDLMRYGAALMPASGVTEVLGLERFVEDVVQRRTGRSGPCVGRRR